MDARVGDDRQGWMDSVMILEDAIRTCTQEFFSSYGHLHEGQCISKDMYKGTPVTQTPIQDPLIPPQRRHNLL